MTTPTEEDTAVRVANEYHFFAHLDIRYWVKRTKSTYSTLCMMDLDLPMFADFENITEKSLCGACVDIAKMEGITIDDD